jgi:hypothetical protein
MGSSYADNDGRFPDDSAVEVRYPATRDEDRAEVRETWPWLPGSVAGQCGPDEWHIIVEVRALALLEDGSPAPEDTPDDDLWFPGCFRDSSEIRKRGSGDA